MKCKLLRIVLCLWPLEIILLLAPQILLSEDNKENCTTCLDLAVERIIEIRSFPEKRYLNTLDGQEVDLNEFYVDCLYLFPKCYLFEKFYYWQSEIREVVSDSENGPVKHKIRCYCNCLSRFCPETCDTQKTHGDVAEFYDSDGNFMGIAVYMGNGKYCSLPYSNY